MRFLYVPLAFLLLVGMASADDVRRVVFHLDEADPARQNLVLNNASNVNKYYQDKGEEVEIEIFAYGPGLTMLIPGKSPVPSASRPFRRTLTTSASAPAPIRIARCPRKQARTSH